MLLIELSLKNYISLLLETLSTIVRFKLVATDFTSLINVQTVFMRVVATSLNVVEAVVAAVAVVSRYTKNIKYDCYCFYLNN